MRFPQIGFPYKILSLITIIVLVAIVYNQSSNITEHVTKRVDGLFSLLFPQFDSLDRSWLNKSVKDMSDSQVLQYLHWADRDSCLLSYDYGGKQLVIGGKSGIDGQKTICMDKGVAPEPGHCLVYSIGISNEWSFDDAMDQFGCQVYAFDPSMGVKSHNRSSRVHFYDLGLGSEDTDSDPRGWKMRKLSTIYQVITIGQCVFFFSSSERLDCIEQNLKPLHGDVPIDVLKMDIEDGEWQVLPQIIQLGFLDKIKQIAIEIHYPLDMIKRLLPAETLRTKMAILKQLEQHGMVRFALRPNRYSTMDVLGRKDHVLYEVAWFNSKYKDPNPIS